MPSARSPRPVTRALLRRWPLPALDSSGDKEERGRVLVVGGASEMPGALILAGTAALRAGAGKLQLATRRDIMSMVGVSVPEARVFGLDGTASGGISPRAGASVARLANAVGVVLVGPGMIDRQATLALLRRVVPALDGPALVLDAEALMYAAGHQALHSLGGRVVLTPHAGEMASLLGIEKSAVERDSLGAARGAARSLGAVVALKGAETHVAAPDGTAWRYGGGNVGLATSGSGDTLAGIVAGLLARGAPPAQAAVWAVYLHGAAGNALVRQSGGIGFLARELLDEVPRAMGRVSG